LFIVNTSKHNAAHFASVNMFISEIEIRLEPMNPDSHEIL